MPTILGHAAVPLAARFGLGAPTIPHRLLWAGIAASMAPDCDVYLRHVFDFIDHRGITHSLAFALVLALLAGAFARALQTKRRTAFAFIFVAAASHGLLDAFTTGGSGIEFFWPFIDERYFMPVQMIEVSPIGFASFFGKRGLIVLASELVWVWSFAVLAALVMYIFRKGD